MHCAALATAPNSACCPPPMTLHSSRPNHVQTRFTRTHNAVYPTYQEIIVQGPTLSQWRNQVNLEIQDPIRPEREYAHPALNAYYPVQTKRTSLCAQPLKESAMSHVQYTHLLCCLIPNRPPICRPMPTGNARPFFCHCTDAPHMSNTSIFDGPSSMTTDQTPAQSQYPISHP